MPATVAIVPDRGRLIVLEDWFFMSCQGGDRASIEERALYRACDWDEGRLAGVHEMDRAYRSGQPRRD
jgi:hypothetical protein